MIRESLAIRLINISCLPSSTLFNALVEIHDDISPVLPYLNAVIPGSHYRHDEKVFDFMHNGHIVTLLPGEMKVTGMRDQREAESVVEELRALINETWEKRESIEPRTDCRPQPSPIDALRCLPRTNCGRCEERTCLAFAVALTRGGASIDKCPMLAESGWNAQRGHLERLLYE